MDASEKPAGAVVDLVTDTFTRRKPLVGTSTRPTAYWATGRGLPRGGDTILYSGLTYQIMPYLASLAGAERRRGERGRKSALARRLSGVTNVVARPDAKSRAIYNQMPITVMHLLREAGVSFGVLYEDELYSGSLAYELGLEDAAAEHAQRVHAAFKKHGVNNVITIDPHTTMMLRDVYPRLLDGYDVGVRNYLEVLAERAGDVSHGPDPAVSTAKGVAIHDACLLTRDAGMVEEPRLLLRGAGVTARDPEDARSETACCGGAIRLLDPLVGDVYARRRIEQLKKVSPFATTMCPFCYSSLRAVCDDDLNVTDIAFYLRRGQTGSRTR